MLNYLKQATPTLKFPLGILYCIALLSSNLVHARESASENCLSYFEAAKNRTLKNDLESKKLPYPSVDCLKLMQIVVESFLPENALFNGEPDENKNLKEIKIENEWANSQSHHFIAAALRFLPLDQALVQILNFEKNVVSSDEIYQARKQSFHNRVVSALYLYFNSTPGHSRALSPGLIELIGRHKYPQIQTVLSDLEDLSYLNSN
ncbi:MAG: hypothetical protein R3A80_05465 [Bdellovibrionota bacterium]